MNNARLLMILTIFLFALIFFDSLFTKEVKHAGSKKEESVLSAKITSSPTPEPQSKTDQPLAETATPTPIPTTIPNQPTPTPSPTPQTTSSPEQTNDLTYPNAKMISNNNGIGIYESTDSPKTITDWYKEKMRQQNMNTNSFVQTNTNGKVLNKLVVSSGNKQIQVDIENNNSEKTKITVSYTNR